MTPSAAAAPRRARWVRPFYGLSAALTLSCATPAARGPDPKPQVGVEPPPRRAPAGADQTGSAAGSESQLFPPGKHGLDLRLLPRPELPALCVRVTAYGDTQELRSWHLAEGTPSELSQVRQLFAGGQSRPLSTRAVDRGVELLIPDDPRETAGALSIEYCVRAAAFDATEPLALAMDPNHFRAVGERALLLPDAYQDTPVPTRVAIRAAGLGAPPGAASSLGVGLKRELELSVGGLRHAAFMAGPLGSARFSGPEGSDETAWVGYTAFDPRPVAAQVATFRSAAREYFGDPTSRPLTLMILSDARATGAFDVARRTASVLVQLGIGQPWDGPLSLAVSHQLLREWLGSRLSLSSTGSSVWFDEGFSRYLARELSFRVGHLEPEEYAAEFEALTSVTLTSPLANLNAEQLAPKLAARDAAALTLEVARGALWASQLHADLARKGQTLHKILRELYAASAPVTAQQLIAAVDAALGCHAASCTARRGFDKWILSGATPQLPSDALGVCFKAVPRSYPKYQRGFSVTAGRINQITPGGPAARSGLQLQDRLISLQDRPGDASAPLKIRVERGGQTLDLSFLPRHGAARGSGWVRLSHVPRERCARP